MGFLGRLFRYGGKGEVTLADANQTITEDDASARVIEFVGTLTAARTITMPNIDGADWELHNNTTGGYALTIAGAQGAGTVTLANGGRARVVYDADAGAIDQSTNWASPGTIGSTTPSSGAFTTLSATGTFTASGSISLAGDLTLTAGNTAPAFSQTAKSAAAASQAGENWTFTAQSATAGTSSAGAAAGGSITITAGNAARYTSGDANGGNIELLCGQAVGSGQPGALMITGGTFVDETNTAMRVAAIDDETLFSVWGHEVVSYKDLRANTGLIRLGSGDVMILQGSGSPEGVVTAPVGSTYHRTDGGAGTTLYVKESGSGNTGWAAK